MQIQVSIIFYLLVLLIVLGHFLFNVQRQPQMLFLSSFYSYKKFALWVMAVHVWIGCEFDKITLAPWFCWSFKVYFLLKSQWHTDSVKLIINSTVHNTNSLNCNIYTLFFISIENQRPTVSTRFGLFLKYTIHNATAMQ